MTDLDTLITDLRAKAEAATPGPWERRQDPVKYWHAWVEGPSTHPAIPSPDVVCTPAFSDRFHEDDVANMDFIAAANPAAIFTILDALDEARGELERRYDPGYIEDLLRVVSATDQNWREVQAELATLRAEVERLRGEDESWRHIKRGTTYRTLGVARAQCAEPIRDNEPVKVYRSDADGSLSIRPVAEFHDGRFVPTTPETTT